MEGSIKKLYSIKFRRYHKNKYNTTTGVNGKWCEHTYHTTSFRNFNKKYEELKSEENVNVYCTRIVTLNSEVDESAAWKW